MLETSEERHEQRIAGLPGESGRVESGRDKGNPSSDSKTNSIDMGQTFTEPFKAPQEKGPFPWISGR